MKKTVMICDMCLTECGDHNIKHYKRRFSFDLCPICDENVTMIRNYEELPLEPDDIGYEIETIEAIWERQNETGGKMHPKAANLMGKIRLIPSELFSWKFGGDGDNGEELLLILTAIFEAEDRVRT
jgi:hypothetical protein